MSPRSKTSPAALVPNAFIHCLVLVALAALTVIFFWPVTRCDFVNYDDPAYVTLNTQVQKGLTAENLTWAFTSGYASNWHPLTWISHMLDCQIYGLESAGHHGTNLFLHVANTLLLFFVFKKLTDAFWRSALLAAFFALHPLHVESVAWVAERKDVLSTFFGLLSLLFYAGHARAVRQSPICYGLSLSFFALSLMSKPMLVTLPFVLLLLDFWPLNRFQRATPVADHSLEASRPYRLILEKVPFVILAITSSVVTFLIQHKSGAVRPFDYIPLSYRIINAVVAYLRYIGKTFWPTDLAVFYPAPEGWPMWQVGIGALILIFFSAFIFHKRIRFPYLFSGWFWFLGTLVPVIGIVQVGAQSMADRYAYVPIIGLIFAIVWFATDVAEARSMLRIPFILCTMAALFACSVATKNQLNYWKNSVTLFRHALAVTSNNYVAHINLASALKDLGQDDEATLHFQTALKTGPDLPEAHFGLAEIFERKNQFQEAAEQYTSILGSHPKNTLALNNLGSVTQKLGKPEEASFYYAEALKIDPNYSGARYNLASALSNLGRNDEAIEQFQQVIRLRPDDPNARNNLAVAFVGKGDFENAAVQLRETLRLRPDDAEAHFNFSYVLSKLGKTNEAKGHYDTALRLNPHLLQNKK